jgi:hypothetical protein
MTAGTFHRNIGYTTVDNGGGVWHWQIHTPLITPAIEGEAGFCKSHAEAVLAAKGAIDIFITTTPN